MNPFAKVKKNREAREIFGVRLYFVDGMVRLKDIHKAYLKVGERSEGTTDPSEWYKLKSTKELIDYLQEEDEIYSGESPGIKVIDKPLGNKGGVYVCKELAHDYARWLDRRYAVAILRTFDSVSMGDYGRASAVAKSVCKPVFDKSWDIRIDRMRKSGRDPYNFIEDIFFRLTGAGEEGMIIGIVDKISDNPSIQPLVNRVLDTAETAMDLGLSLEESYSYAVEKHSDDPAVPHLVRFLESL